MDNFGFERLIETVLHGLGAVDTKIVPRSKDKGIDIYATFLVAALSGKLSVSRRSISSQNRR